MFDVLTGQYKNLASKGRYGDTMLAHINPQEAALLKSMGGAGSINPNTGLPEFYGVSLNVGIPPQEKPPAPSIGQAVDPSKLTLPLQLPTKVIPQTSTGTGKGIQLVPEKTVVADAYDKYKTIDYSFVPSKSGAKPQELGYEIPVEGVKFQGVDLVGVYDNAGKFLHYTAPVTQSIDLGNGYLARPFINASGGLTEFRQYKPDSSGILESGIRDLGPLALAALGANLYSGVNLLGAPASAAGTAAGVAGEVGGANFMSPELISSAGGAGSGAVSAGLSANQIAQFAPEVVGNADKAALFGAEGYGAAATPAELAASSSGTGILSSLGNVGSSALEFAKANPSLTGSLLGAGLSALNSSNAPKEQTNTTSIDPQIKAEYLANLERAKQTAAGLEARQIAQPGQMYTDAEQKLYNLGMTPFGEADIAKFYNPYQEQVVQGALGDIERTRQMQEQANMAQATAARAFGGSRQGVISGMTNEAALRQAATTGGQLRSAGFTQAANLGLAARPMDIAGLQTSLGLGTTRTSLEQARLDALRNLGQERLAITSGALGLQPANVGQTSTQPLYSNTAGNLLSGGLTGAYIGSLLGGKA